MAAPRETKTFWNVTGRGQRFACNFGSSVDYFPSPLFGQSTQTLNNWLGSGGQSGGINPLYEIGGPRSV
ncbi:MAG TPA: hypothetical protein VMU05_16990 [Dongiaceae bacterium]|nr:hypothetical protein [Dongiaceae bacterium]